MDPFYQNATYYDAWLERGRSVIPISAVQAGTLIGIIIGVCLVVLAALAAVIVYIYLSQKKKRNALRRYKADGDGLKVSTHSGDFVSVEIPTVGTVIIEFC